MLKKYQKGNGECKGESRNRPVGQKSIMKITLELVLKNKQHFRDYRQEGTLKLATVGAQVLGAAAKARHYPTTKRSGVQMIPE